MNRRQNLPGRLLSGLARAARQARSVLAECHYAQRRVTTLMTAPDRYLVDRDRAPEDYPEFLFRTSSALLHEPSARRRAGGHLVG
jgi:hypothetical protein